jgi:fumarylacetoacetase
MADKYASHFGINNIPYGIASSYTRARPQCVTRIGNDVIFLAELAQQGLFKSASGSLTEIFLKPTLNAFATQQRDVQSDVRKGIQKAYGSEQLKKASEDIQAVTLHLPVSIGDFTDYSASASHVQNAAEAITGTRSFPPAFHKYPVGYSGRCSSIALSGTAPVTRPLGQFVEDYTAIQKNIIFGPSCALDYEFEIGAVIGRPTSSSKQLHAKDADEHIFGLVLVNDWSARDIQALEMAPLGPFNGKNFATSISPWVVTMDALKPFEVPAPKRTSPLAPFMDDPGSVNYNIHLEGVLTRNGTDTTTCKVNFNTMYWTFRHMIAHHTIGGCELRTGDLVASGTVSGEGDIEHGCLLEMTWNGKKPVTLNDGSALRYLEDGDAVRYTGVVGNPDSGVGFGECLGVVKPARV